MRSQGSGLVSRGRDECAGVAIRLHAQTTREMQLTRCFAQTFAKPGIDGFVQIHGIVKLRMVFHSGSTERVVSCLPDVTIAKDDFNPIRPRTRMERSLGGTTLIQDATYPNRPPPCFPNGLRWTFRNKKKTVLPTEVCEQIIDLIYCDSPVPMDQETARALKSCQLVCKAWSYRSRHYLLHTIIVRDEAELQAISRALSRSRDRAARVRQLILAVNRQSGVPLVRVFSLTLVRRLPNVKHLCLRGMASRDGLPRLSSQIHLKALTMLSYFTSLSSLTLQDVTFPSITILIRICAALHALKTLECQEIHFVDWCNVYIPTRPASVSTLVIRRQQKRIGHLLAALGNLTTLVCDGGHELEHDYADVVRPPAPLRLHSLLLRGILLSPALVNMMTAMIEFDHLRTLMLDAHMRELTVVQTLCDAAGRSLRHLAVNVDLGTWQEYEGPFPAFEANEMLQTLRIACRPRELLVTMISHLCIPSLEQLTICISSQHAMDLGFDELDLPSLDEVVSCAKFAPKRVVFELGYSIAETELQELETELCAYMPNAGGRGAVRVRQAAIGLAWWERVGQLVE